MATKSNKFKQRALHVPPERALAFLNLNSPFSSSHNKRPVTIHIHSNNVMVLNPQGNFVTKKKKLEALTCAAKKCEIH